MDFLIGKVVWLLDKFGAEIHMPTIPFEKFSQFMTFMQPYMDQANVLFPVDDILVMLAIILGLRAVLWVIWAAAFIRKMLPF